MEARDRKFFEDIAKVVKKEFEAEDVILFGSYAKGNSSVDSDVDILVIMKTPLRPPKQAALIRMFLDSRLGIRCPMDLIVRTPGQVRERLKLGDCFIKEIITKGVHL